MPGANEVLRCPQFFLVVFTSFLNFFLDAPLMLDAQRCELVSLTFFAFTLKFSYIYLHFFQKTPSLDAPRLDARGRRTPGTPLCTPLVTTVS